MHAPAFLMTGDTADSTPSCGESLGRASGGVASQMEDAFAMAQVMGGAEAVVSG